MKCAIVAAGGIAYVHLKGILKIPDARVVAIVDKYYTKAEMLGDLCGHPNVYTDIKEMLEKETPDVVHICAPPQLHYPFAKICLEAKTNVILEKPFTIYTKEAEELYALADKNGVKLCPMHNHMVDKAMQEIRTIVDSGEIGEVVSVDSHYGFNLGNEKSRYNVKDSVHWVYNILGGHFSNIGPHAMYMALQFLGTDVDVKADAINRGNSPNNLKDDLRIILKNDRQIGYVTVTLNAMPYLHYLTIFGSEKIIQYDIANWFFTIRELSPRLPNAFARAYNNLQIGKKYITATMSATLRSLTGRLTHYDGMWDLIRLFYESIKNDTAVPVSRELTIGTVRALETAFRQIDEHGIEKGEAA